MLAVCPLIVCICSFVTDCVVICHPVHKAAAAAVTLADMPHLSNCSNVEFSGATVHFVDEQYDTGPILAQAIVAVNPHDTPQMLAARVLKQVDSNMGAVYKARVAYTFNFEMLKIGDHACKVAVMNLAVTSIVQHSLSQTQLGCHGCLRNIKCNIRFLLCYLICRLLLFQVDMYCTATVRDAVSP